MKKPAGAEPFPAVMLVPGCSGFNSETFADHYERVQDQLVKLGFVTLRIGWLAVRNAANCYDVGFESVVGDIGTVADYLRQQDYIFDKLNVGEDLRHKIYWQNAMEFWGLKG